MIVDGESDCSATELLYVVTKFGTAVEDVLNLDKVVAFSFSVVFDIVDELEVFVTDEVVETNGCNEIPVADEIIEVVFAVAASEVVGVVDDDIAVFIAGVVVSKM